MRKINFWDKCGHHNHSDSCYAIHAKKGRTIEYATDGSGEFDVFTHDAFGKVFENGYTDLKVGWLQEPRGINSRWYQALELDHEQFFSPGGFNYIITHDQKLLDLDPRFIFILGNGFWIKEPKIYQKSKLVSMISSNKTMCAGHHYRLSWVDRLKGKLDLYGRGFNEIALKEEGLCDYMFSVAIENQISDTWITEKVMDCFASGTVPIYGGTRRITEHFNADGIIFLDASFDPASLTPDMYYERMDAIEDNLDRVRDLEIPVDFIFDPFFVGIENTQ